MSIRKPLVFGALLLGGLNGIAIALETGGEAGVMRGPTSPTPVQEEVLVYVGPGAATLAAGPACFLTLGAGEELRDDIVGFDAAERCESYPMEGVPLFLSGSVDLTYDPETRTLDVYAWDDTGEVLHYTFSIPADDEGNNLAANMAVFLDRVNTEVGEGFPGTRSGSGDEPVGPHAPVQPAEPAPSQGGGSCSCSPPAPPTNTCGGANWGFTTTTCCTCTYDVWCGWVTLIEGEFIYPDIGTYVCVTATQEICSVWTCTYEGWKN